MSSSAMRNLRDVPLPDAVDTTTDGAFVRLSVTELDWLLNQTEDLSQQYPDAAGETLQAMLLAKRLSPVQHLVTQLQDRAATYQHTIRSGKLPDYLQTDLIASFLNALNPHFKNYSDPQCFVLSLQRDSEYLRAQLHIDTQAVGEPVALAYRYALDHALLVEHQGQVYAISPDQLVQVMRLSENEWQGEGTVVQAHGGAPLPIGRVRELHTLFGPDMATSVRAHDHAPLPIGAAPRPVNLLLMHTQDAVRVDQILGHHRRLIRPIHLPVNPLPWLSGGSRLPDGRVALHIELTHLPDMN